jgi:putative DNA primase/helicase
MGGTRLLPNTKRSTEGFAGESLMNVEIEIAEAMRANGIMPPRYISLDGKLRRFGKNKSSWCVFFDGHVKAGAFGDWKTGVSEKYVESRQDITPKDRQRIAQQMREAAVQREANEKANRKQASIEAARICNGANGTGTNHYLVSKGLQRSVDEYGLPQKKEPLGSYIPFGIGEALLIVPAVDIDGAIWSLQVIAPDGRKRFYPGGKLRGHFCPFGLQDAPEKILIAEGVATALTLFFNANNLVPVAESFRWKYPNTDILICGDDDHMTEGNPGRTKAIEAAVHCGGDWVLPDFSGLPRGPKDTDFNDLRRLREAV